MIRKQTKSKTPRSEQLDALAKMAVIKRDKALGPLCRICGRNPWAVAYHIVPKQRGNAIRWVLENIVLACSPCNAGEHWHRSLYRDKHIAIFGKEYVEGIEAIAMAAKSTNSQTDKYAVRENLLAFLGAEIA